MSANNGNTPRHPFGYPVVHQTQKPKLNNVDERHLQLPANCEAWEYAAFMIEGDHIVSLNELGACGWELCVMHSVDDPKLGKRMIYVKRKKSALVSL